MNMPRYSFLVGATILSVLLFVLVYQTPPVSAWQVAPVDTEEDRSGAALFAAYHQAIRSRSGEKDIPYETGYQVAEFRKARASARRKVRLRTPLPWIERGPANVGGRTRGLLVDPADPTHQTWYAGSVGGGVWKTEDAGVSWRHLTEGLPNLSTSHLAMATSNPDIIYLGTGEGYSRLGLNGSGLWKSTDRGETWEQLPATAGDGLRFGNVMRIAVNPADPDELLICTRSSRYWDDRDDPQGFILKSRDGGQSWSSQYESERAIQHIIPDPTDFNTFYAAVDSLSILKSTDAGETWREILDVSDRRFGRMELGIAPSDPNFVYFSAESLDNDFELFRSSDSGQSWTRVIGADEENDFGAVFGNGQGWYDNTIAVHPYDPEIVFVGGAGPILQIFTSEQTADVVVNKVGNEAEFLELIPFPGSAPGLRFPEDLRFDSGVEPADYVDIEIRFGPGRSQRIHRFFAEADDLSGLYRGYDSLPFEVWDVENDRQLMAGFTDENDDGEWSLRQVNSSTLEAEAILVYPIPYDAEEPDGRIREDMNFNTLFSLFIGTPDGGQIDFDQVGPAAITVDLESLLSGLILPITDGYGQYPDYGISGKGVHVDHHNLLLIPVNQATRTFYILNANDGGVAFSRDGGQTFVQTGSSFDIGLDNILLGYNTAQFYGIDKMNGADRYVGGTQDNGSWVSGRDPGAASEWAEAPSGDGFEAAWHYRDSLLVIQSSQFNSLRKSTNGGISWQRLRLPGGGPFLTRLANSKQEPDLLFAVSDAGVLRSEDFGDNWEVIEMDEQWVSHVFGPPIEISLANPAIVWTGNGISEEDKVFVSRDGGSTFSATAGYSGAEMGRVTGIATHPTDLGTAYLLFSQSNGPKILKTTDLGESWTDLSGFNGNQPDSDNGFPDVATYCLLVMPFDTNRIWVGTEIGLFESLDGGQSWLLAESGLPATAVWEMKIVNDEVVVATHGRGIWTVALPELLGYEPFGVLRAPAVAVFGDGFNGLLEGTFSINGVYDSTKVRVEIERENGQMTVSDLFELPANEELSEQTFSAQIDGLPPDTILNARVRIVAYKSGSSLEGSSSFLLYSVEEEAVGFYENDFSMNQGDFARLGFNILQPGGFSSPALHSLHPYPNLSDLQSILRRPIEVDAENSLLTFDEIVLVEIGDTDVFGEPDFFDFVAVEATKDRGRTWRTLAGYDSQERETWLEAYFFDDPGNPSLVYGREIDLLEHFSPGDTIYLKFRLFSDRFLQGWGWMVDNLLIGDPSTSSIETGREEYPAVSVFPNPARNWLQLKLSLPDDSSVTATVFGLDGKQWSRHLLGRRGAGTTVAGIDVAALPAGTYLLEVRTGKHRITKKIVKL